MRWRIIIEAKILCNKDQWDKILWIKCQWRCHFHSLWDYSEISNNRISNIQTTSIQWTNHVPPIDFTIQLIHFQPPRYGQPLTKSMCPNDCKLYSESGQRSKRMQYFITSSSLGQFWTCLHKIANSTTYKPHPSIDSTLEFRDVACYSTFKIGTTTQQRTRSLLTMCPSFRCSTVLCKPHYTKIYIACDPASLMNETISSMYWWTLEKRTLVH